ncbi:MAG: response regulator [Pseudomonadota bacterium]
MPTILIVDDDKHACSLLERVLKLAHGLRQYHLRVVTAVNGEQGLAVFDAEKPDVVIADLLMPKMDGFRFCQELRNRPAGREVGLIVTSGLYRDRDVQTRIRDQFGGVFYAKPYQIGDLAKAVGEILAVRMSPEQACKPAPESSGSGSSSGTSGSGGVANVANTTGTTGTAGTGTAGVATGASTSRANRSSLASLASLASRLSGSPAPSASSAMQEAGVHPGIGTSGPRAGLASGLPPVVLPPKPAKKPQSEMAVMARTHVGRTADDIAPSTVGPMEGNLARMPLGRLLLDLYDGKATGALTLRRGRLEKRIDLVVGYPTTVSSNSRREMLGHFLVARRIISETQHQTAIERAHGEGEKLGTALVELGLLTPDELLKQLTAQACFKITNALRWQDGSWSYSPDRELLDQTRGNALNPSAVVLLGLRETASLEAASQSCQRVAGRKLLLTERGQRLRVTITRAFGDELAKALDGRPTIESLLSNGEPSFVLPAVEALLITGCLEAGRHATAPVIGARHTTDPLGLTALSRAPARTATPLPIGSEVMPDGSPASATDAGSLYDLLFGIEGEGGASTGGGSKTEPGQGGGQPDNAASELDSGMVAVGSLSFDLAVEADKASPENKQARENLIAEYLRIQGKDWYSVLKIDCSASTRQIEEAFTALASDYSLENFARHDLGCDYSKLDELHTAYRRARTILLDGELRAAYDRQLAKGGAPPTHEALGAEIQFRRGEQRLVAGSLDDAIDFFRRACAILPNVADYHAALGWALHLRSRVGASASANGSGLGSALDAALEESERANKAAAAQDVADAAAHLAQALSIDPDHAAGHEYTGRVIVDTDGDGRLAGEHLERALAATPPRMEALAVLETLRARRGEHRQLERQYRKLIYRLSESDAETLFRLWISLARLYLEKLADRDSARIAYQCAIRQRPDDGEALRAVAELCAAADQFPDRAEALRSLWRLARRDPRPIVELFEAAVACNRHDTAFAAAGVLVGVGMPNAAGAAELHARLRPSCIASLSRPFLTEIWPELRHPEDEPDLSELFACLEPMATDLSPIVLQDLDASPNDLVEEHLLGKIFRRVCARASLILEVDCPPVIGRADFGGQVHLGACTPPVLLAGPRAIDGSNELEIGFYVARSLSYLWPGRALGGSRPARKLKSFLLACAAETLDIVPAEDPGGDIARARAWLRAAPRDTKDHVRHVLARITRERDTINLSRWRRALARSANRVALLLCGDPAVAIQAVATIGATGDVDDLIEFTLGSGFCAARQGAGLAIH